MVVKRLRMIGFNYTSPYGVEIVTSYTSPFPIDHNAFRRPGAPHENELNTNQLTHSARAEKEGALLWGCSSSPGLVEPAGAPPQLQVLGNEGELTCKAAAFAQSVCISERRGAEGLR